MPTERNDMGLLDGMMPGAQAPAPQGGLLGSMGAGAAPAGGAPGAGGLQMAQQLAQNPTPQMAQQVIAQLQQKGTPEAQQISEMLSHVMNNPEQIKEFAQAIIQRLSGQQ